MNSVEYVSGPSLDVCTIDWTWCLHVHWCDTITGEIWSFCRFLNSISYDALSTIIDELVKQWANRK